MGKWNNRRWAPRRSYNNRKYKDYDYEELPPSPPSPHYPQSNPPAIQKLTESPWEVEFCKSVRVPWKKVVAAKKFMYCHDNVTKWDDSASLEAFNDAKRRYWEMINSLPFETTLPDPDMYIDEIDWNTKIDAGLILELDQEYFNTDEVGKGDKLEAIKEIDNQVIGCSTMGNYENPDNEQNAWESGWDSGVQHQKDASPNWGQCTKTLLSKSVCDPWEQSDSVFNESSKHTAWKDSADKSWSWNREQKYGRQSTGVTNSSNNLGYGGSWDAACVREKGKSRISDGSTGWKQWNTGSRVQQDSVKTGSTWQRSFTSHTAASWDRGWRDCGKEPCNWKQLEDEYKLPNNEFRRASEDGKELHSGCRKRDGSFHHQSRYKTYRFQGRW